MELSNEGFQALSARDYVQAEASLERALSINPDNPYALLNRGVVYQETGRLDKARKMYEKVIAFQLEEVAEESNTRSFAGKGLADIARENLKLLEAREAELATGKPAEAASAPAAEAPVPAAAAPAVSPMEPRVSPKEEKVVSKEAATPASGGEAPVPATGAPAVSLTELRVPPKEAFYRVGRNDSLLEIAGRKEVYGDVLKWPSLYRLNRGALEKMKVTESVPVEKLPEGLRLRYVSRDEASERLAEVEDKLWVVDVASARSMNGVVPPAILLLRKGYQAYLTKTQLAGEEWIRLRVGFYKDILEAMKVSDEVKAMLSLSETPMPTKIDRMEWERFAVY
jgi:nucleoid-associated protein YgaU